MFADNFSCFLGRDAFQKTSASSCFQASVLEVRYKDFSVDELLGLSVDNLLTHFTAE